LGIGAALNGHGLTIRENSNPNSDPITSVSSIARLSPVIKIKSHDNYFTDSSWAYQFFGSYTTDELSKTDYHYVATGEIVYLSPPIKITHINVGATLYYTWGDKIITNDSGKQHNLGISYGFGLMKIKGTIPANVTPNKVGLNIDENLNGLATNIYYEYNNQNWFFTLEATGTDASNGKGYRILGSNISFGRYFDF